MTEAENTLQTIRAEIKTREEKLRSNTEEAVLLQRALERRYLAGDRLEVELAEFEALAAEAEVKVAAERAEWLQELRRQPKPLVITHFEETPREASAVA